MRPVLNATWLIIVLRMKSWLLKTATGCREHKCKAIAKSDVRLRYGNKTITESALPDAYDDALVIISAESAGRAGPRGIAASWQS